MWRVGRGGYPGYVLWLTFRRISGLLLFGGGLLEGWGVHLSLCGIGPGIGGLMLRRKSLPKLKTLIYLCKYDYYDVKCC